MSKDIVDRLRAEAEDWTEMHPYRDFLHEAADEIERLRAATAALEETLRVARSDLEIEAHDAKNMAARLDELEAALAQNTAGLTEATVRLQRVR
jgi:chromosome segregation ATPase